MMTELIPGPDAQVFDYQGAQVRTVTKEDEPWFVASDVAKILGYRAANDLTRRLDDDEKGTRSVRTPGGIQEMTVISESGLYAAVLGSKVEAAQPFKRWVTREVLPTIRKTGAYSVPTTLDADTVLAIGQKMKEQEAQIALLEAQVEADAPKVLFANVVEASADSILIRELAKLINKEALRRGVNFSIGATRLFQWMREGGYLIKAKAGDWNQPTQKAMELGLFEVIKRTVQTPKGARVTATTKVTGKGQIYFINKILGGQTQQAA